MQYCIFYLLLFTKLITNFHHAGNTIGFRNLAVGTARHAVVHAWRLDQEKGVDIQTLGSNYHVVAMVGAPVVAVPNPVGSNCRKNLLVALPREVLAQLIAAGVAALVALPRAAVAELDAALVDCLNAAGGGINSPECSCCCLICCKSDGGV